MKRIIRIGTRDSALALWQAHTVEKKLNDLGFETEIIAVKSTGDLILDKPLYELGITGIFTKTLDIAMLKGQIDIAVHSMKDVPTALPKGIVQAAVLERANTLDILIHKGNLDFLDATKKTTITIGTGSLRRQAQWLHKFPDHKVEDLRGNVATRLQKVQESAWQGAIFAAAGLERLAIESENYLPLDWMIPAPAQGAMVVVTLEKDLFTTNAISMINDAASEICTFVERQFLKTLEGGCTAPIGALAVLKDEVITFKGALFSLDGVTKIEIKEAIDIKYFQDFGKNCALKIQQNGGLELMESIKKMLNKN
jgi:hydroxymethylbilane synthase